MSLRALVINVLLAAIDGERFKAGGKVVKNVTGYDLPKLLAGSWGTLAVLTEVTIRVMPAPELDRTLVVASASAAESVTLETAALTSPHDVSAAGFDPARGTLLRIEGFAAVDAAHVRGALRSGHATLLKASAADRAKTAVFQPLPGAAAVAAARLKQAFDPRGILSPGRMD